MKMEPARKHVLLESLQKTRKIIQGLCLLSLSPHSLSPQDILFLLVELTWSTQYLSTVSLFLSVGRWLFLFSTTEAYLIDEQQ